MGQGADVIRDSAQLLWWEGEHTGQGLIVPGHGHDADSIRDCMSHAIGTSDGYATEEVWLTFQRRVKWCSRTPGGTGFSCDDEGEWHSHWWPGRRNPEHPENGAYTVVIPHMPKRAGAGGAAAVAGLRPRARR